MKPNVILIVCDTLSQAIMSRYGGPCKMPNLEKLGKDGMVYDNCISPETWTFPSHVSLFTGMYPSEHKVHETADSKIEGCIARTKALGAPRLAEQLYSEGYNTISVSNNPMLSKNSGFDYGFKTFIPMEPSPWARSPIFLEAMQLGADPIQVLKTLVKTGKIRKLLAYAKEYLRLWYIARASDYPVKKGADLTMDLLEKTKLRENFFLFINFFDMHDQYKGENWREMLDDLCDIKRLSDKKVQYLKHQYSLSGEFLDMQLGRLFEMLKKKGRYDNTLIIVTSDHGQAFNEHGYMYHGTYLYDEIVRVPLIVKYPNSKKFRKREGYQSLVCIPDLISDVINGLDDKRLTRKKVFAEAYGSIDHIPKSYSFMKDYFNRKYEKVRKAIYMDGYKLTVNGSSGEVEEFLHGEKKVSTKSAQHRKAFLRLAREMKRFKKKEDFKVPDL